MSVSKNWKAISISGIAGYDIIVTGDANVGMLTVMPELVKRVPQGISPATLQLNLVNASDATPENFQPVRFVERIDRQNKYSEVEIFHKDKPIERIKVEMIPQHK
jgi:hypothetical protein